MTAKTAVLIGFPHAGQRWNWTGHAEEIAKELEPVAMGAGAGRPFVQTWADVYGLIAAGLGIGLPEHGDITGAAGSKVKRARAVGIGEDEAIARADVALAWLLARARADDDSDPGAIIAEVFIPRRNGQTDSSVAFITEDEAEMRAARAAIVADIDRELDGPRKLLTLAGGRGYGEGRYVTLTGGGMAARAARYIMRGGGRGFKGRGIAPSDTSLQDAAGAAVARLWLEWTVLEAVDCATWSDATFRHLAAIAWRAAFQSLTRDASEGRTGRKAGQPEVDGGAAVPLDKASLEIERKSLVKWAATHFDAETAARARAEDESAARARASRKAVLVWLRRVIVTAKGTKLSNGQREQRKAQRARLSLLARLIHGRDWATASRGAGFANGRAAALSFQQSKTWQALRQAAGQPKGARELNLVTMRQRAARAARAAIIRQRASRAGAGRPVFGPSLPLSGRRFIVPTGAATVEYSRAIASNAMAAAVGAFKVSKPAATRTIPAQGVVGRGAVHPLASEYASATAARGAAVAMARAARADLRKLRAARLANWDGATKGLRAGWLNGHKAK